MMTQFELDARRHELNYELQARNHEALRQYNEKRNLSNAELNGLCADYQAEKRLLERSLDNLLKERRELKARGLEYFAPEMQDSYLRERSLHRDLQDARATYDNKRYALAARKEAERMAYEEQCMLNKKWYAEQLRLMLTEAEAA